MPVFARKHGDDEYVHNVIAKFFLANNDPFKSTTLELKNYVAALGDMHPCEFEAWHLDQRICDENGAPMLLAWLASLAAQLMPATNAEIS